MKIRKVNINDLTELSVLFDAYRVFYEKESNLEEAKIFLADRINKNESKIFVAENDLKNLVGFVQLYPIFSSTRMKKLWLLNDLFVDESQRNKGISIALIDAAKTLCTSTNSCGMILETAKKNLVGNKLYPKTGFELDFEHNHYEWNC